MDELWEDDAPFLAAIASTTEAPWSELGAALEGLDGADRFADWAGGDVVDVIELDGVEQPVTQVPYPVYTEAVERLRRAIGACGLVVPYDWMGWPGLERYREARDLADASAADAVRLVVAIVRSERFSDGSIEGALRSGLLQAALQRILAERASGRPRPMPEG